MLRVFFKSRDSEEALTENFKVKEFACKDGSDVILIDDLLIVMLQDIRDHFGKPIIINSGYRTPGWNTRVDGEKYSYHMQGKAADIVVKDVSAKEVAKYASERFRKGGIICYTNFVHIDTRQTERYRKGVE